MSKPAKLTPDPRRLFVHAREHKAYWEGPGSKRIVLEFDDVLDQELDDLPQGPDGRHQIPKARMLALYASLVLPDPRPLVPHPTDPDPDDFGAEIKLW